MPEQVPEYPEVIITDWPRSRLLVGLGYWITRVSRRKDTANGRPRFLYAFRMRKEENDAVQRAYYSSDGLQIDARDFDIGEQVLIKYQKFALASPSGAWVDGED